MKLGFRKFISIILAVFLTVSIAAPAFTVSAVSEIRDIPVVYIGGRGSGLYKADGSRLYPLEKSATDLIKEKAGPVLLELSGALITDEWDAYCDALVEAVASVYADLIPNADGEVVDGSYPSKSHDTNGKTDNYRLEEYVFYYDWRLDPCQSARELNDYINAVLAATGKDKVRLVGRCYGSNIVTAYFYEYGYDKVEKCLLYVPTALGSMMAGALFAGKLEIDPTSVETFLYQSVDYENDPMMGMIASLVTLLNEAKVLGLGTGAIEKIYAKVKDNVLPRIVLSTYGAMPSYWAMVNDDYYDEAKKVIFTGREEEYAKFIEKIDYYHENVISNAKDIYKKAEENGVVMSIICKYNVRFVPVFENSDIQADDSVETYTSSFGATCADYTEVLPQEYIDKAVSEGKGKYISADKKIDASTCMFPDRTWFIRDIPHSNFPNSINELMVQILNNSITVDDNEAYPQFMTWDSDNDRITPVEGEVPTDKLWGRNIIEKFFTFIVNLFKYIKVLFSGIVEK